MPADHLAWIEWLIYKPFRHRRNGLTFQKLDQEIHFYHRHQGQLDHIVNHKRLVNIRKVVFRIN